MGPLTVWGLIDKTFIVCKFTTYFPALQIFPYKNFMFYNMFKLEQVAFDTLSLRL